MTKKKDPKDKKQAGRPSIMTESTLQKLEYAFSMDCTDDEACLQADIAPATLYNYQKEHPEFLERKRLLKQRMILKSRHVISDSLDNGDKDIAKWYLERKRKDEFSIKQEVEAVNTNIDITDQSVIDKVAEKIKEL